LKSAVAGGAGELEMNTQHPTSNIQHPVPPRAGRFIGCSLLDVGCWVFLLFNLSLAAQTPTNVLPALSPAYPELPATFWEQHQSAIIVGGFAILAFAFFFLKVMLRPESPQILPPDVLARQTLAKLQSQPEDGKVLSEISQTLRRYISTAFEFPSGELTTAEFSAALSANNKIGSELAQTISSFLRECDERKFSPPDRVGVQASACPANESATPDTLKRELQPAATRALEIVALAEVATHRQDACATKNERRI
jgi:hypothetical protein